MPTVHTTAYATVEQVMLNARALINDMLVSQGGEILTDTAPFTFVMLNLAARYLEMKMANNGVQTFTKETILTPITPINFPPLALGAADPGQQVNISDVGFFDGNIQHYPPQLPPDLMAPIKLWERVTGSQEYWREMDEAINGLPSIAQGQRLRMWEWRTERIYMPGATRSNDIRLRYEGETAQFATPNDTLFVRGADAALGNYLAALYVNSRNPQAAAAFSAAGDDYTGQIITSNVHSAQQKTITRRAYGRNEGVARGWPGW